MQVEELSPRVGKTGQLSTEMGFAILREQRFIANIIVHHQMPRPGSQELPGMFPTPAWLVVEDNDARPGLQIIAAISPKIGFAGFAVTRIQLCYGRFVGM